MWNHFFSILALLSGSTIRYLTVSVCLLTTPGCMKQQQQSMERAAESHMGFLWGRQQDRQVLTKPVEHFSSRKTAPTSKSTWEAAEPALNLCSNLWRTWRAHIETCDCTSGPHSLQQLWLACFAPSSQLVHLWVLFTAIFEFIGQNKDSQMSANVWEEPAEAIRMDMRQWTKWKINWKHRDK